MQASKHSHNEVINVVELDKNASDQLDEMHDEQAREFLSKFENYFGTSIYSSNSYI